MARQAVGEVFVDFEGDLSGLEKSTKKAERIVKNTANKLEKESRVKLFSDKLQGALGALAGIETVARGLPAVFDGINFAVKQISGSMADADAAAVKFSNTIDQIPVFGTVKNLGESVRNFALGEGFRSTGAILAEEQQERAERERIQALQLQRAGQRIAAGKQFGAAGSALNRQLELAGLEGVSRQIRSLEFGLEDTKKRIESQFLKTNTSNKQNIAQRDAQLAAANALFQRRLDNVFAAVEVSLKKTGGGSIAAGGILDTNEGGSFARSQQFSFQRSVFGSPTRPINVESKQLDQMNKTMDQLLTATEAATATSQVSEFG